MSYLNTAINETLGAKLGIGGRFAKVPSFQIVNDAGSKVRWVSGAMVSHEHGAYGAAFLAHPAWQAARQTALAFQPRLTALGGDAVKAAALYDEVEHFISHLLRSIESDVMDRKENVA